MKITGTSSYVDVECDDGRVARFEEELLLNGFLAYRETGRWLPAEQGRPLTVEERDSVIGAALAYLKSRKRRGRVRLAFDP